MSEVKTVEWKDELLGRAEMMSLAGGRTWRVRVWSEASGCFVDVESVMSRWDERALLGRLLMKIYPDLLHNPNNDPRVTQQQNEDWYYEQQGREEPSDD